MNEVSSLGVAQDPIQSQQQPQYLPSSTSAADFQEVELAENNAYRSAHNVTVVESLADHHRSFEDVPAAGAPVPLDEQQATGQTDGSHAITVASHHRHHNAFRNPPIVLQWKDVVYSIKGSWSIRGRSKEKIILNKVSGYVMPGEVLAILGPSGAGKTSLLNILSHRVKERSYKGSVTANGNKIPKRYHALAAFVQQDDILNGNLSVKETLIYTALLKLPKSMTFKQKIDQVNEIIEELGLQKCKDTKVGIPGVFKGISGGERKRLSIGVELITNPSILFLDEPTTGLDAKTALNIMHAIRRIAKNGRTVVLTIHQPRSDIFHLFDKLLLLARGKTAYFGKASEATNYFEKMGYMCPSEYNPADFIIDLVAETPLDLMGPNTSTPPTTAANPTPPLPPKATIQSETELSLTHKYYENLQHQTQQDNVNNKEQQEKEAVKPANAAPRPLNEDDLRVEKILAYYEQNHQSADVAPPVQAGTTENLNKGSSYASSWITQFLVILVRSFISYIRDRSLMLTRLAQNLVMSILIGIIFLRLGMTQTNIQDRSGVLFFILINQTMNNLFAAMMAFPAEAAVFSRERSSKTYRISSYYLGKVLAEIPNLMVFPILFGTIVYWMVGLNPGADRFFIFLLILVSITFAAQSLGYLISAVAPKPELALTIAPVVTTVLMLFGGFYLNVENIPVYFIWVYWISFFHYAYEALILNEWTGATLTCLPDQLKFGVCPVTSGQQVIDNLKMNGKMSNLWFDIGMILAFALVCKILSFFALRFLRKPKIK